MSCCRTSKEVLLCDWRWFEGTIYILGVCLICLKIII